MTLSCSPLVSSRIIHCVPDPADPQRYELQFAPRHLVDEIVATAAESRLQKMTEFLSDADLHVWRSVQNTFFESMGKQQRELDRLHGIFL